MSSAKMFLKRDIINSIKEVQKTTFDIVDIIRAIDIDNYEQLKVILNDEELAKKFLILHENMGKVIRKKILDSVGTATRNVEEQIERYDIQHIEGTEIKGIIKH